MAVTIKLRVVEQKNTSFPLNVHNVRLQVPDLLTHQYIVTKSKKGYFLTNDKDNPAFQGIPVVLKQGVREILDASPYVCKDILVGTMFYYKKDDIWVFCPYNLTSKTVDQWAAKMLSRYE